MSDTGAPATPGEWKCPDCGELFASPLFRCTVTGTAFHMGAYEQRWGGDDRAELARGQHEGLADVARRLGDLKGAALPGSTATEPQQAQATEEQLVQAIAIALFEVMEQPGMSPWESAPIPDPSFGRGFRIGHAWELYVKQARAHLAAMNVLAKFVSGQVVGL